MGSAGMGDNARSSDGARNEYRPGSKPGSEHQTLVVSSQREAGQTERMAVRRGNPSRNGTAGAIGRPRLSVAWPAAVRNSVPLQL